MAIAYPIRAGFDSVAETINPKADVRNARTPSTSIMSGRITKLLLIYPTALI